MPAIAGDAVRAAEFRKPLNIGSRPGFMTI
jgi:hypothetical protein